MDIKKTFCTLSFTHICTIFTFLLCRRFFAKMIRILETHTAVTLVPFTNSADSNCKIRLQSWISS